MEGNSDDLLSKNLPFYTGLQKEPRVFDYPERLPFKLIFNSELGLIVQEFNPQVDIWIQKAYQFGSSLSTPLGEGSFSQFIAQDIILAIMECLGEKKIEDCSFLEIGCGQGYLLYLLKEIGAKTCIGIEPDPRGQEGAAKYNVEIIRDFFNVSLLNERFDVVFSYGVLEHIQKPLEFIKDLTNCLKDDGIIFSAVPNCEKGLELGDFALLAHEHYNYFTPRSLQNLYRLAGLGDIQYSNANYGWALYVWGTKKKELDQLIANTQIFFSNTHNENELYIRYIDLCYTAINNIQLKIKMLENEEKKIGVYGAFSYFMLFDWKAPPRFFDGDTAKHGLFVPACLNVVESPYVLKDNPVDAIFVAPIHYDLEIRHFLEEELGFKKNQIISIRELLSRDI